MTSIARLELADAPQVQRLFERCADFFVLTEGEPPAPDLAEKELTFAIPGSSADDTACFGVFDGDRLTAFALLLPEPRKPSEWWLGLLLLDPAERSRGLGPRIHKELVEWLAEQGATKLWIAVLAQNEAAERFWRRIGYEERNRQPYVASTGFASTAIVMSIGVRP
ncbi:MAG TPA: GNAT family N-acetyltransferase [Thermoanaerobaculia bacterium]